MRNVRKFLVASCASLLGCSPALVPGTDPSRSGKVLFYSTGGIDTSSLSVGGVRQGIFDLGIQVSEGEHPVSLEFSFMERDCPTLPTEWCEPRRFWGECRGSIRIKAGRNYRVNVARAHTSVSMSALEEDSGEFAGGGDCSVSGGGWW